jgi:hypothetical protein
MLWLLHTTPCLPPTPQHISKEMQNARLAFALPYHTHCLFDTLLHIATAQVEEVKNARPTLFVLHLGQTATWFCS